MPTDEQRMREQFEASGLTSRPLHLHGFIWEGFRGGYRSRDAEVQALRKLVSRAERLLRNAEVRAGYCACGDGPDEHPQDHLYLDMGEQMAEQWLKGVAALRGEEGGAE